MVLAAALLTRVSLPWTGASVPLDRMALEKSDGTIQLTGGVLCLLPHGSSRRLVAGADGLTYLTVHRRRPGMQIRPRPS